MTARLAFVFVDGLGLGSAGAHNPLRPGQYPGLERLFGCPLDTERFVQHTDDRRVSRGIDASLGVPGLPQSGTGQATLFTGVNCARIAGRHYGPFPHSKTRETLREENVFSRLIAAGIPVDKLAFANAFPARFFDMAKTRDRWSVTTRCCLDSGVEIRTLEQMKQGDAIPADLTGNGLVKFDTTVLPTTARVSGQRFGDLVGKMRFSLFEYFLTDKAGHKMDHEKAGIVLRELDQFVDSLLDEIDPEHDLLVLTSDHGNVEDLSIRTHTMNAVPFVAYGSSAQRFADATSLVDIVRPCVEHLVSGHLD